MCAGTRCYILTIGIKERLKCEMLTHEGAFAAMCRMLGLAEITEIIGVSDATIREKCGEDAQGRQLATLLIALKRETQRQAIAALVGGDAGGAGGGSGGQLDVQDAHNRMGGHPNHASYKPGDAPRALLRTMQGLR